MDPSVSTSFIPKKPLVENRRGSAFGLIFLISLLVFIGSIAAAGAVFFYGTYLKGAIEAKATQLQTAQGAFEAAGAIDTLVRLDSRINEAKGLLTKHVSPSAIFFLLSVQTLERVRFNTLDYDLNEDGTANILLTGETDDFATIALQSDQLGASKVLRNIIFSDIAVVEEGVTFAVSATVEPSLINYGKNLTQTPTLFTPTAGGEEPPAEGATTTEDQ